ncbi:hypothetical protein GLP21_11290 [Photobacterium carnosum]|uniref:antiviral RADAR system accessory protein RdrD n=1 Tax=Photobacterium carnosum TaxID=2023717 RepID=UPI00128C8E77|nr:antiviral RADAR system accessory protein RdrD [Photobacterium carnosum]KAE8177045.1 hypothetical protein CIT27_10370 [Photobacterium carnosum]MCD9494562.1 hypothetical protein [Photobacterium carnosum]MCD9549212.1 hypothetical protein [Photobacterium carnosum]MCF2306151.1 hypothetical protein [Photobacterium carnosum]
MQKNDIKIKEITSFDDIIVLMTAQSSKLKEKSQETEWQRHIARRIPVYAGTVMVFFLACLLMTTTKALPLEQVGNLLSELSKLLTSGFGFIILILLYALIHGVYIYKTYTGYKWLKHSLSLGLKLITALLFLWIISFENKSASLFTGIMLFGTATFSAMLADRTLGYTRRNERYDFFSKRAEAIATKYTSLKAMPNSSFSEQHLNECLAFFEQIYLSKYNDTVTDSFYLLSQIEKKVAG